jgi:hypothetical protein
MKAMWRGVSLWSFIILTSALLSKRARVTLTCPSSAASTYAIEREREREGGEG